MWQYLPMTHHTWSSSSSSNPPWGSTFSTPPTARRAPAAVWRLLIHNHHCDPMKNGIVQHRRQLREHQQQGSPPLSVAAASPWSSRCTTSSRSPRRRRRRCHHRRRSGWLWKRGLRLSSPLGRRWGRLWGLEGSSVAVSLYTQSQRGFYLFIFEYKASGIEWPCDLCIGGQEKGFIVICVGENWLNEPLLIISTSIEHLFFKDFMKLVFEEFRA